MPPFVVRVMLRLYQLHDPIDATQVVFLAGPGALLGSRH